MVEVPKTKQIETHLKANMNMRKRDIITANFLGGLAWGLGTVIGATIVAAIVVAILKFLNFVPGVNLIINQFPK